MPSYAESGPTSRGLLSRGGIKRAVVIPKVKYMLGRKSVLRDGPLKIPCMTAIDFSGAGKGTRQSILCSRLMVYNLGLSPRQVRLVSQLGMIVLLAQVLLGPIQGRVAL